MHRLTHALVLVLALLSALAPLGAAAAPESPPASTRTYLVRLADAPVADYAGGVAGLAATAPRATGAAQLEADAPAAQTYRAYLGRQRARVLSALAQAIGRPAEPLHTYEFALNGLALVLTPAEAGRLAALPGVAEVQLARAVHASTDRGPAFIGAAQEDLRPTLFLAELSGASVRPAPVSTGASARAVLTYNAATRQLAYQLRPAGLSATRATIGRGGPEAVGATVAELSGGAMAAGSLTLSGADEDLLFAGELYLSLHSAAWPDGEVRGQIAAHRGEGVIVGVIDSGINFSHPSFADVGGDGYNHTNPRGAGNYLGVCDPSSPGYQPGFQCNDKLIGAYSYTGGVASPLGEPSPADDGGHGSHVAATAAGNVVAAEINGTPVGVTIAGVAPHANLIAYDVLDHGSGSTADIVAAVDQALADGVDVLNLSLGAQVQSPWADLDARALNTAFAAGVIAAVAAGNSGPDPETVAGPAAAPWAVAVGGITHDGGPLSNSLSGLTSSAGSLPDMAGNTVSGAVGPAPMVHAATLASTSGPTNRYCLPFANSQALVGKIVVCDRNDMLFVDKAQNAAAAGAIGMVVASTPTSSPGIDVANQIIPAIVVDVADGEALRAWLATGSGHVGRIEAYRRGPSDPALGNQLGSYSGRGPLKAPYDGLVKPNIVAPGTGILAAGMNSSAAEAEFDYLTGTSMASPHIAGALALLRGLHPEWTPAELASAMATTAHPDVQIPGSPATLANTHEAGAGRVDVARAALAGLVLNESAATYLAADPTSGGDPSSLNIPELAARPCIGACTWTRTVRSTMPTPVTWTAAGTTSPTMAVAVSPASFTLAPGESQQIVVTASFAGGYNAWSFGALTLTPEGVVAPASRLSVTAYGVGSSVDRTSLVIDTEQAAGSHTLSGVRSGAAAQLTPALLGLVKGQPQILRVPQGDDVVRAVQVPAGAQLLVADLAGPTAQSLSLEVFQDGLVGGTPDGSPQGGELVCERPAASTRPCALKPASTSYLVMVRAPEGAGPHAVTLYTAVAAQGDSRYLTLETPAAAAAGAPYDITLRWSLPELSAGDRWYGRFSLFPDAAMGEGTSLATVDLVIARPGLQPRLWLPLMRR